MIFAVGDRVKIVRKCTETCNTCNIYFGKTFTVEGVHLLTVTLEGVPQRWKFKLLEHDWLLPEDEELFEI